MESKVIIKKVIKKSGGHGSSSWKIALADFMTALMIVFFVLWVTASSSEDVASAISNQFTGKATINIDGEIKEVDQLKDTFEKLRELVPDEVELNYDSKNDIIKAELKSDLLFKTGSAVLSKKSFNTLNDFSETISSTGLYIHVYGYADNTPVVSGGEFSSNLELSTFRAISVAKHLIDGGMRQDEITVHGEGQLHPIATNDTRENKSKNRRVEMYISISSKPSKSYEGQSLAREMM